MSLSFTRASEVAPGDPITSRQYNLLADAFNDRLRSGVGDPTWRTWWRAHSLVRHLCDDSGTQTAPVDDYWRYWNLVDPRTEPNFECAAGRLTAQPINIFHDGDHYYPGEPGVVAYGQPMAVSTDEEAWYAAIMQRGAWSEHGVYHAPARAAAVQHRQLSYMGSPAPYLKGWGGFIASPATGYEIDSYCFEGQPKPFWFVFTPLRPDLDPLEFVPVCPDHPDYAQNLVWMDYTETGYVLYRLDGSTVFLSYDDYIEGPYTLGGQMYKTHAEVIPEMVNRFSGEFKGSLSQRAAANYDVQNAGFNFQSFLTRQYPLAPAYGMEIGGLTAVYPVFTWLQKTTGSLAECSEGGDAYQCHDGYVFGGYFAKSTGLTEAVTIELLDGADVVDSFTLNPSAPTKLKYFETGRTAAIKARLATDLAAGAGVSVHCAELKYYLPSLEDAYLIIRTHTTSDDTLNTVDTTGDYYAQSKELWDTFAARGCLGPNAPPGGELEMNPVFDTMRRQFQEHLRFIGREFSGNPTLLSYQTENGKSVLRFSRYGYFGGSRYDMFRGIAPPDAPIASGALLSGVEYLVRGGAVTYHGTDYGDGQKFTAVEADADFTAAAEASVWQVDGIIPSAPAGGFSNEWLMFLSTNIYRDYEGSTWKPENYGDVLSFLANRCLLAEPYLTSGTNEDLWYGMTNGGSNLHVEAPTGYRYARSAHNFGAMAMNPYADEDFYKSCQVYQPDYEIESAVMEGTGVIKLTLKTRLQTTDVAPAEVPLDVADWDVSGSGKLQEDGAIPTYRTDENALREYLLLQERQVDCSKLKGDHAAYSGLITDCEGSCHPRFYFTRLIPKSHADTPLDNDTSERTDTPCIADRMTWMYFVLAAMCEGYLDAHSTGRDGCPSAKMGDYWIQSLASAVNETYSWPTVTSMLTAGVLTWDTTEPGPYVVQKEVTGAQGGVRWYTEATVFDSPYTVALGSTDYRVLRAVKPVYWFVPIGHSARSTPPPSGGPISNTVMYAEVFNQFARGINLLTRARIELPITVESREHRYEVTNTAVLDGDDFDGEGEACDGTEPVYADGTARVNASSGGTTGVLLGPPEGEMDQGEVYVGSWTPLPAGSGIQLDRSVLPETHDHIVGGNTVTDLVLRCGSGDKRRIAFFGQARRYELRLAAANTALAALPPAIRDLLNEKPSFQVSLRTTWRWYEQQDEAMQFECGPDPTSTWFGFRPVLQELVERECLMVEWAELQHGVWIDLPAMRPSEIFGWTTGAIDGLAERYCLGGPSITRVAQLTPGNLFITIPFRE